MTARRLVPTGQVLVRSLRSQSRSQALGDARLKLRDPSQLGEPRGWFGQSTGLPSAWCVTDGAVSDGSDPWGGAILTVAADTMSPTGTALAVDVTVEMSFTVDATYEIDFSWANSLNGQTMAGWGWKEVVDVDTSSKFRQTWHCLVGAANLDADWELNAVVYGSNAVTFATEFRAIEVNAATEACCQWFTPM